MRSSTGYKVAVLATMLLLFSGEVLAQRDGGMRGMGMGSGMMGMMADSCGMCAGCMGAGMFAPKVVMQTKDGGYLVVVGNTLVKLDSKLKEQTRAVVEPDLEKTSQMITKWRELCPMSAPGASEEPEDAEGQEDGQ